MLLRDGDDKGCEPRFETQRAFVQLVLAFLARQYAASPLAVEHAMGVRASVGDDQAPLAAAGCTDCVLQVSDGGSSFGARLLASLHAEWKAKDAVYYPLEAKWRELVRLKEAVQVAERWRREAAEAAAIARVAASGGDREAAQAYDAQMLALKGFGCARNFEDCAFV